MIYPANFEEKVSFVRIREMLADLCESGIGRQHVADMHFMTDSESITEAVSATEEFRQILLMETHYPEHHIADLRPMIEKLRIQGTYLEAVHLLALLQSLETIQHIQAFFRKKEHHPYPLLQAMASQADCFPTVLREGYRIVESDGRIKDHASPELAAIRARIAQEQHRVNRTIQRIFKAAQEEGWADQDASISIRDGRTVIPVNTSFKRKITGIVHDESATGKTSYIEPGEVVEANNKVRELQCEEQREIVRILIAFADLLRPTISDLIQAFIYLGYVDFLRAKALLAIKINAVKPVFHTRPDFNWIRAVHPVMYLTMKKEHQDVIPLDIALNSSCRILMISGPNAGGKSVCLKTVGLLQYMFQCGLLVPVSENSEMGLFRNLCIDIGDEQSIDNALSTYSSHLLNMKHFIRIADAKTLILIDEFGSGTEPVLGGAIAEAVLSKLNQQKVYGIVTTHYGNLKQFAESTEGMVNGSMLYDMQRMCPLFRLEIGKPGSSFAFEIARKIGLPEDILNDAEAKAGQSHVDFEKYLQGIDRDKRYWERKRDRIRLQEKKLDDVLSKYQEELEHAEKERKSIIQAAKAQAEDLLAGTNRTIENTIRIIKESNAEKEKTRSAREELDAFKQRLLQEEQEKDERIARKIAQLQAREARKQQKQHARQTSPAPTPEVPPERPLAAGDYVRIIGHDMPGEILAVQGRQLRIAVGQITTTVPCDRVERISGQAYRKAFKNTAPSVPSLPVYDMHEQRLKFVDHQDVRGMRAEEALRILGPWIDEAAMLGIHEIKILHGKGTGALRQTIRDYLRRCDEVDSFADEDVQQGGAGITVVQIK